jgi:hypothetical protein
MPQRALLQTHLALVGREDRGTLNVASSHERMQCLQGNACLWQVPVARLHQPSSVIVGRAPTIHQQVGTVGLMAARRRVVSTCHTATHTHTERLV